MDLVQFVWEQGTIPADPGWTIFICIPKINSDTSWIGFLKVLWKVVEAIIGTHIKKDVDFCDVFHGFSARRGDR